MIPEEVLNRLQIEFQDKVSRLQLHCPFHHDVNPSAGFYRDSGLFYCFSCELILDVPGFYAKFKEISRKEALITLGLGHDEVVDNQQTIRRKAAIKLAGIRAESVLQRLSPSDLAARGEKLDKIIWCWDHGLLTDEQAATALKKWEG